MASARSYAVAMQRGNAPDDEEGELGALIRQVPTGPAAHRWFRTSLGVVGCALAAFVAAALAADSGHPHMQANGGGSIVGLAEIGHALKLRAQAVSQMGSKVLLSDEVLQKKPASMKRLTGCPGFGSVCNLTYPMPYKWGTWPETYDYTGSFPDGFVWGMGTAAYQIEGAYRDDGRGASIWDTFSGADTVDMPGANCSYCCKEAPCKINAAMFDKGATGNVAADHYNVWRTDVAMMKSMGLKHYRFSISWPRLIPTGHKKDGVNQKAIDFYNDLIDALLDAGITPYVTLYHWDLPQGLLDPPNKEGWWSTDEDGKPDGKIMDDWLDYVRICFDSFGDRVKTWVTFNEAWTFLYLGSGYGKAPSIEEYSDMTKDPWIGGHNVLNAHAAAVDMYRKEFKSRQGGQIGITNNCDWREPKTNTPSDIAAAERGVLFQLGWFSDPIFGKHGDYPPEMRKVYGKQLPEFTDEQKKLLNGSADFYGLNHYGTGWAAFTIEPGDDLAFAEVTEDGFPRALSIWLYGSGWGFRKILNWVAKRYDNPPLFVTEGGWSVEADGADEAAADRGRTMYYANYSAEMLKAIHEDKVDIRGYFAWSLMDNYEWERGYVERFGLVYTDFQFGEDKGAACNKDRQPTPGRQWRRRKESSCWLEHVWRRNELIDPRSQAFAGCATPKLFEGTFSEAGHDGCLQRITVDASGTAVISGNDALLTGRPDCGNQNQPPCTDCSKGFANEWIAKDVNVSGGSIVANFSMRAGGHKHFSGFWDRSRDSILWQDGSSWKKISEHKVTKTDL